MPQLKTLLDSLTPPTDVCMQAQGYLLWFSWQGELKPVIPQFTEEYGGLKLGSESNQMLFFFFSSNVFLASSRLEGWARLDQTPLTLVIMPATLTLGAARTFALELPVELQVQQASAPAGLAILMHPDVVASAVAIPGIKGSAIKAPVGLAPVAWQKMEVDSRLPYQANLSWYSILRPLGNPLDKEFQSGWRNIFDEVEKILQRNKFRYTVHDFFLMFPLESVHQMKTWANDFLHLIHTLKQELPDKYWPCALTITSKKGLTFNNELPHKIDLDWDMLVADHPYMSFQNALLLGDTFAIHEVRFAAGNGQNDWCSVGLIDTEERSGFSIPLLTSGKLVLGEYPFCFYCGHHSHAFTECPTRKLPPRDRDVWRRIAGFDFATMKEGIREIDEGIKLGGLEALSGILEQQNTAGIMGQAIYDINTFVQLRNVEHIWRTKGKLPSGPNDEILDKDYSPIWELWDGYSSTDDKPGLIKTLQSLLLRFPRDHRIKCFLGFIALERGDHHKAIALWKDAGETAPSGFLQAWYFFLQARATECFGKISSAMVLYEQSIRACPQWSMPTYRKIVCQVKTGFVDSSLAQIESLLHQDTNYFNIAILDPEMERGQIQLLTGLGRLWLRTQLQMQDESEQRDRLRKEIGIWFTADHPFAAEAEERLKKLQDLARYNNFVPYIAAIHGRSLLERDMNKLISNETRDFRNKFKGYIDKLKRIQDEAAWFPFPKIMVEFNKSFNKCALNINWAMQTNMGLPESFKKAQILANEEEERIGNLEKRLKILRLIRDSTLFLLTMARTFFWVEIIGLLLVLVVLPLVLFYAQKSGAEWPVTVMVGQQWQVQKAATFIISFLAFAFALLRTVLRFEKIRDTLLEKARKDELKKKKK